MITNQVHQELWGMPYHAIIDALVFDEDQGDCCGFAELQEIGQIPCEIDRDSLILKCCVEIDYANEWEDRKIINFVFLDSYGDELILGYDLRASSGSGWCYGAYIRMVLGDKILVKAEW